MLVILFAWALIRAATLTYASGTAIPITLYTDNACGTPSATAANVTLDIGVCAVTPGLGSFDLQPFPCASGSVANYVFSDAACGQSTNNYYRGGTDDYCFISFEGDMAAIMLSCDQTNPGQPTSTTTINVGPIATDGASTSAPSSPPPTAGDGGTNTTSGSGSSSNSSGLTSAWNSLDLGARIGIIVALAVGIPPILLGLYAISQKKQKERRKAQGEAQAHGTPMPTSPYYDRGANGAFQLRAAPSHLAPKGQPISHAQMWAGYNSMTGGGGA